MVKALDSGEGVLIFSDIYGATPCNLATKLLQPGRIEGVAGVNLPMLVRAFTYRSKGMDTMIKKAISGGCDGVLRIEVGSGLCSNAKLRSSTSSACTRARRPSSPSSRGISHARFAERATVARVNAKSIMGVMMLAAGKGTRSRDIETDGPDETEAMKAHRRADRRLFRRGAVTCVRCDGRSPTVLP